MDEEGDPANSTGLPAANEPKNFDGTTAPVQSGRRLAMDRLLMFLGRSDLLRRRYEGIDSNAQAVQASVQSFADLPGAWYRSVPFAVLFTALAALQIAEWYAYSTQVPYSGSALSKLYDKIDVATLPETSGRWTRPEKVIENNRPPGHVSPTRSFFTPPH